MDAKFLQLNIKDFTRGLIISALTVVLSGVGTILSAGAMPTVPQLKVIGLSALAAGISYLIKNLLTNSQDKFLSVEPKVPPTVIPPA